jgi:hypothetical protein
VFHFNKGHLADPSIPMWVLKTKGESYYVNHVDCSVPWSTKETPDNPSTKGSLKVKDCLLVIDDENCATISELSIFDKVRLENQKRGITRIITPRGTELREALANHKIKHGPIKTVGGACSTTFYITDIYHEQDVTLLVLVVTGLRKLMPNESYYRIYDDPKYVKTTDIDLDAEFDEYEEDEDD